MDDEIIAFSPVWITEIFRTDVTRVFNGLVYTRSRSRGTKLFLSVALILTKENLFASSNVYNMHILLRLGNNCVK